MLLVQINDFGNRSACVEDVLWTSSFAETILSLKRRSKYLAAIFSTSKLFAAKIIKSRKFYIKTKIMHLIKMLLPKILWQRTHECQNVWLHDLSFSSCIKIAKFETFYLQYKGQWYLRFCLQLEEIMSNIDLQSLPNKTYVELFRMNYKTSEILTDWSWNDGQLHRRFEYSLI